MIPTVESLAQMPGAPNGIPTAPAQNPVAALAQQAQQRPTPTHAQTVAGLHRFHEIETRSAKLLENSDLGKANIRPKVLDMGADLIASKVMTLPEFMQGLQTFPSADDLLAQKKWVQRLYDTSVQAQQTLLTDHAQGGQEPGEADGWSQDGHADHMVALSGLYKPKG